MKAINSVVHEMSDTREVSITVSQKPSWLVVSFIWPTKIFNLQWYTTKKGSKSSHLRRWIQTMFSIFAWWNKQWINHNSWLIFSGMTNQLINCFSTSGRGLICLRWDYIQQLLLLLICRLLSLLISQTASKCPSQFRKHSKMMPSNVFHLVQPKVQSSKIFNLQWYQLEKSSSSLYLRG